MSAQDQTTLNQTVSPDVESRNATQDILTTAEADGRFGTLLAAIRGASLEGAFNDPELVTVFLPTDDAINNLNTDMITRLMHPESHEQLDSVLRHHILRGAVSAADLGSTGQVRMSDGQELKVQRKDGGLTLGGANLLETDIICTNGVIHVIDAILMPAR